MTDYTLDMSSRIFLLSYQDAETTFMEICKIFEGKSLHWVEFNNGNLLWKMSRGGTDNLLNYVNAEKTPADKRIIRECIKIGRREVNEESIWGLGERTVLVVAEPGMGKSSTTTHVARRTKERDPTSWVVRINWNDHTRKLQAITAATFNFESLVEFLCNTAFSDSKYTDINRILLKRALLSSGNVTVLMDGFDEISPDHADKAAVILSELMETKVGRVWVTSRPVMKERLENKLSVIAFSMKRLSHESQHRMLCKLLRNKAGGKEFDLEKLTHKLLRHLNRSVYDRHFTGCPLYVMMIAAVCEADMETFFNWGDWFWPKTGLVNLYEKFVEIKLDIYLEEKQKADKTNCSVLNDHEYLKEIYLENFEKCALGAILPPPMLENLHNNKIEEEIQPFLRMVQDGKDKRGVVMNVVEGKAHFVHRTFAEYFTARWFSKNFESNRSVLNDILFDPKYSVVRYMFDRILARGCPLHCAVLEGDKECFSTHFSEESVVNAVDKGGRNLMHLIAATRMTEVELGWYKMRDIVWQYAVSLDTTDILLQWTPLQYAIKSEDWSVVKRLLDNNVDSSGLDMIRQRADDPEYIGRIVIQAAMEGHLLLLEGLRSIGVNIHQASSFGFPSPLHAAIHDEQLAVVKWFIKHGADCNTQYSDGQTPLFYAASRGFVDIVRALVEEGGVSLDVRDDCGRTAIDWAKGCASDPGNIYSILLKDGAEQPNEILKYLRVRVCKESGTARQDNDT
jgi:ankyrin repeat protein